MFEPVRRRALQILRIPHDPDPPAGAPGSARVFRAGANFYKLRLVQWCLGQMGALVGILLSLSLLDQLQPNGGDVHLEVKQATAPAPPAAGEEGSGATPAPPAAAARQERKSRSAVRRMAERWPEWLFPYLTLLEWAGVLLYLIQIPITYAMVRLDYELRWYIVTDRSLRIRAGLASVQETTMSFANVQQVAVSQGPLQRLLGIADLRVQSAGGGGDQHERGDHESLHTGIFHGVDNANEVRDLILERLRAFRQAGLGDPDETHADQDTPATAPAPAGTALTDALAAARDVLEEARALRRALQ